VCACVQDKDGPKALDEFCRDLCEEVRQNKIDPVSAAHEPFGRSSSSSSSCCHDRCPNHVARSWCGRSYFSKMELICVHQRLHRLLLVAKACSQCRGAVQCNSSLDGG
jgi:hypothetical protein